MRKLLCYCLLLAGLGWLTARATVYVDGYVPLSSATVGSVVTASILTNGTLPLVNSGWHLWTDTGPRVEVASHASFTVGAHGIDDTHLTQVGGINQPTTQAPKCMAFEHTRPGGYMYAEKDIPAGHRVIQVLGWIKPGMNTGGANNFYDLITIKPGGGANAAYMQIQAASTRSINVETTSGGTRHTAFTTLQNQWYWYVFRANFTSGTTSLFMYNTDGAQVVNVSSAFLGTDGDISVLRFGNGENGDAGGTTYFQDTSWDYTYNDYIPLPNAGLVYPPERMADWNNAGFTIPSVTTIFTTVPAGSTWQTVSNAMNACPSNQVVQLASGTYNWGSRLDFTPSMSGVVLRGTKSNGTNTSFVNWSDTRAVRMITFDEGSMATEANVTTSIRKGATSITVASVPTWVRVGRTIGLDMLNDDVLSSVTTCREGANIYRAKTISGGNGDRGQAELVYVTATNATTITVREPILHDFPTSRTPQVFLPGRLSTSDMVKMCGIEDITFDGSAAGASSGARCMSIINGYNCWITGCDSINSRSLHIFVESSYQCVIRSNYLWKAMTYANTGEGYGITFYEWSTRNLVRDNIIRHCGANIQFNYGSAGNVAAYNYCLETHSDTADAPALSIHGNSADYNLFEGNFFEGKARFDCVHGSSYANFLFRNRGMGKVDSEINNTYGDTWQSISGTNPNNQIAVDFDYWNHDCTALGNVFGVSGFHTVRLVQAPSANTEPTPKVVYKFGFVNAYGYDEGCLDAPARLNYILHNNWDPVTSGIAYDAGITNHSLSNSLWTATKPANFGSLPWPPYGPGSVTAAALSPTNIPAGYRYVYGGAAAAGTQTNLPTVDITAPTGTGSFATNSTSAIIGGTSTADSGNSVTVVSVVAVCTGATTGSFSITGSTSWSSAAKTLNVGVTVVTVTVTDSIGQTATDTLIYSVSAPDTLAPIVVITQPTLSPSWFTNNAANFIGGSITDAVGVVSMTWSNNVTHQVGAIAFDNSLNSFGTNVGTAVNGAQSYIIRAADAAGNIGSDSLLLNYTPPPSTPANLSVDNSKRTTPAVSVGPP